MNGFKPVYRALNRGSVLLNRAMRAIVGLLVLAIVVVVFLQVLNRYILVKQTFFPWRSITWTDELARYLLVAISYFALGMCYRYGHMARADMVYSRLGGAGKKILYLIESVLIAVFLAAVAYYGFYFARANGIFRSDLLRIPGNILYSIPLVGYFLVAYELITEVVGVVAGEIEPFTSASGKELYE